jgi:TatD DNase family protein
MDRATRQTALVDTHCHIDLYSDPMTVIEEIERQRVYTIAVTNTPSVFNRLCELVGTARFVRPSLGLHPELAAQRHLELNLFEMLLPRTRYVGEIGLDYQTTIESERATQRRVLGAIIGYCDAPGGKIVTVHSRRAADDVVDAFGSRFRGTYILHWYSGGVGALRRALANGAYISVNPAMVRSRRGRTLIAEVPRERVLTETDGPFVSVEASGGTAPAKPVDVAGVVEALGRLWSVDLEEARTLIYRNFTALLRNDCATRSSPARSIADEFRG